MALLKCPECGGKVSSDAKTCLHCGYNMENVDIQENIEKQNESKNDKKNIILLVCIIVITIALSSIFIYRQSPYYAHKQFEEASEKYDEIWDD